MYAPLLSLISVEWIPSRNKLDRGYVVGGYKIDEDMLKRQRRESLYRCILLVHKEIISLDNHIQSVWMFQATSNSRPVFQFSPLSCGKTLDL
jgi:hypothetical protein